MNTKTLVFLIGVVICAIAMGEKSPKREDDATSAHVSATAVARLETLADKRFADLDKTIRSISNDIAETRRGLAAVTNGLVAVSDEVAVVTDGIKRRTIDPATFLLAIATILVVLLLVVMVVAKRIVRSNEEKLEVMFKKEASFVDVIVGKLDGIHTELASRHGSGDISMSISTLPEKVLKQLQTLFDDKFQGTVSQLKTASRQLVENTTFSTELTLLEETRSALATAKEELESTQKTFAESIAAGKSEFKIAVQSLTQFKQNVDILPKIQETLAGVLAQTQKDLVEARFALRVEKDSSSEKDSMIEGLNKEKNELTGQNSTLKIAKTQLETKKSELEADIAAKEELIKQLTTLTDDAKKVEAEKEGMCNKLKAWNRSLLPDWLLQAKGLGWFVERLCADFLENPTAECKLFRGMLLQMDSISDTADLLSFGGRLGKPCLDYCRSVYPSEEEVVEIAKQIADAINAKMGFSAIWLPSVRDPVVLDKVESKAGNTTVHKILSWAVLYKNGEAYRRAVVE